MKSCHRLPSNTPLPSVQGYFHTPRACFDLAAAATTLRYTPDLFTITGRMQRMERLLRIGIGIILRDAGRLCARAVRTSHTKHHF